MSAEVEKLRPYDFDDDGVRQCPARVRKGAKVGQCRTVVLCPAIFCRAHWKRLPGYLQKALIASMISEVPIADRAAEVKELVRSAIAFLLGPAT